MCHLSLIYISKDLGEEPCAWHIHVGRRGRCLIIEKSWPPGGWTWWRRYRGARETQGERLDGTSRFYFQPFQWGPLSRCLVGQTDNPQLPISQVLKAELEAANLLAVLAGTGMSMGRCSFNGQDWIWYKGVLTEPWLSGPKQWRGHLTELKRVLTY